MLIVEDEEEVRSVTADILQEQGYDVLSAGDGHEALQVAGASPKVDLLLADVVMPGLTGPELAGELTRTRDDLKVVFMTGYSALPGRPRPVDLRYPTLTKPFTREELVTAVGDALEG